MAIGLFRMAFLVMFERTLTQFMKGIFQVALLRSRSRSIRHRLRRIFQVALLRNPTLDVSIKLLALTLVFAELIPDGLATGISVFLALLMIGRFIFWKPQLGMRRLDLGIMYLGYLALVAQLLINFMASIIDLAWVGTVSVHVFAFGVMGLVIPAMLIRIAKGHTGRKVVFDNLDKAVLLIMILGFIVRIVTPQIYPAAYLHWIYLAATCWLSGFSILTWRYIPYLMQARVDGKMH